MLVGPLMLLVVVPALMLLILGDDGSKLEEGKALPHG
jgi:hypothetical protein